MLLTNGVNLPIMLTKPSGVIKAILYQQAGDRASDISDVSDMLDIFPKGSAELKVELSNLKTVIESIGGDGGFNTARVSPGKVGCQLKASRFKKSRNPQIHKRERLWTVTPDVFIGLCQAYGVVKTLASNNKESPLSNPDTPK